MRDTKRMGTDLTQGSIPRSMLGFAIPFMLSTALQVVYSLVDMAIVGRFVGSHALSGVSIASQVIVFFTTFCVGYSFGGQVYISQAIGRDRRDVIQHAVGTLFSVTLLLAVVFTAVCLLVRHAFLRILHTPPESYEMALEYLVICGGGLVFSYGYNLVSSILRGMGDSKRPLLFISIATVVNIVLDLLFTGLLGWGVAGAAWATIIGQASSFLFALVYLYRRREQFGFDFRLKSFAVEKKALTEMSKPGAVMAIQYSAIYISMMFVNSMVNREGVYASAAFGVGIKLDDLIIKISQGFQAAALAMVGQSYATGDHARVKKVLLYDWGFVAALYAVYFILYTGCGAQMFGLFTDDVRVISLAPVYIRAIVWGYPGFIIMRATNALVQGTGNARLGFVSSLLDALVLRIGLCWLFGVVLQMGLYGFFLGYALAVYGSALPGLVYFLSGRWKHRRVLLD